MDGYDLAAHINDHMDLNYPGLAPKMYCEFDGSRFHYDRWGNLDPDDPTKDVPVPANDSERDWVGKAEAYLRSFCEPQHDTLEERDGTR